MLPAKYQRLFASSAITMPLRRISLRDFVIVSSLELDLHSGFTALTGETGAGKSILIDALQLGLGARGDSSVVREGAARCEISLEFDSSSELNIQLHQMGVPPDDTLLVRRQIDIDGRSRAWINGTATTVAQLRGIGSLLVDIHGQHAWQSLTQTESPRTLLDAYGDIDLAAVRFGWQRWQEAKRTLERAQARQTDLREERERLDWQITEMSRLSPREGEWEELNQRHARLAHGQTLHDASLAASGFLTEDPTSTADLMHKAITQLQASSHIEPMFEEVARRLDEALTQIRDASRELQVFARRTDLDTGTLEEAEQRLSLWISLARRFRTPPEQLAQLLSQWQSRLAELDNEGDVLVLERQVHHTRRELDPLVGSITEQRQRAAARLSAEVTELMQSLGMNGGQFEVQLSALPGPEAYGQEAVEFLVAGHAGTTPKPLAKVASGGELSRLTLAISVVTSQTGKVPTLVFDEVDSGIGGETAHTVGRLLHELGRDRQVLSVTHLPQVAARADHHLVVTKTAGAAGVQSQLQEVKSDARIMELARMLGGHRETPASIIHAKELLNL